VVTGIPYPASPVSLCSTGDQLCIVREFFQQRWTNIRHVFS